MCRQGLRSSSRLCFISSYWIPINLCKFSSMSRQWERLRVITLYVIPSLHSFFSMVIIDLYLYWNVHNSSDVSTINSVTFFDGRHLCRTRPAVTCLIKNAQQVDSPLNFDFDLVLPWWPQSGMFLRVVYVWHTSLRTALCGELVSWCFEPSQPQRIISGLTLGRRARQASYTCSVTREHFTSELCLKIDAAWSTGP